MKVSSEILNNERERLTIKTEALGELYEKSTDDLKTAMEGSVVEKEELQKVLDEKNKLLESFQEEVLALENKVVSLSEKIKNPKRMKMKVIRREEKIKSLTESFQMKQVLLEDCDKKLTEMVAEASVFGQERRRLMLHSNYLKKKFAKAYPTTASSEATAAEEIDLLNQKVNNLETENKELQELGAIMNREDVVCFQNGRYTDELRMCVMELLRQNIAMRNIGPVITTVIKSLTGRSLNREPSKTLACQILKEANYVAKAHVAKCMMEGSDGVTGNCLSSDGTTKFHQKYQSFQITTVSGKTLSIGMKDLAGGDAAEAMASFNHTVADIAETMASSGDVGHLICSLKNTMSDKCSVNHVFNAQLKALRTTLLPQVMECWEDFTEAQREDVEDMGHFFCRMHILVNMALESDKTLSQLEEITLPDKIHTFAYPQSGESGAGRLVRTAVKALHPRGCEQSGAAADFLAFLQEKERLLMLVPYKGNRFNILFYNAAAVYYHRQDIQQFLESLPSRNRLLSAVLEDTMCKGYVAGVRALGLLDKFVTGPYWRKLNSCANILAFNEPLNILRLKLEELANDSSPLLDGTFKLFQDVDVHIDAMYDRLLIPDATDATTHTYLEALMHSLLLILERQAEDQLPGGKHHDPSDGLKRAAANVPTTNIISERDFGSLDMLLRMKPAASTHGLESLIMWTNNKTGDWFRKLTKVERDLLMDKARKNKGIINRFKAREEEVKQSRMEHLKKKQQSKKDKEDKQYSKRVNIAQAVEGKRICYAEGDVDTIMAGLSEKEASTELHLQLQYHQHVLKSKGERRLFAKSHKGCMLTAQELKVNLVEVISNNVCDDIPVVVVSEEPDAKAYSDLKAVLIARREKDRDSRLISKEKQKLSGLMADPESLAGKRVKHKCESADGVEWFSGKVRELVEMKDNVMRVEYNLVYDEYPGEVWTFNLLQDLKNGDLIIY